MLSADRVSPLTDANIEAVGVVQLRPRRILARPKARTGNQHKTPCSVFLSSSSSVEMHVHAWRSQQSAV